MNNKKTKLCRKHKRHYHPPAETECRDCEAERWVVEGDRVCLEGIKAYNDGISIDENPYPEFSRSWNVWNQGWDLGRKVKPE